MSGRIFLLALGVSLSGWSAHAQRDPIPFEPPEVIELGDSRFVLPAPDDFRIELDEGLVAFIAIDPNTATVADGAHWREPTRRTRRQIRACRRCGLRDAPG